MNIHSPLYRKAFIKYLRKGVPIEITLKDDAQNKSKYYIWITQGDNKVRPSHQAREGRIFSYDEHPQPGEEYGCRCFAEPYYGEIPDGEDPTSRLTYRDSLTNETKPVPESWSNSKTFENHLRHAKDFGAKSGEDYVKQSQDFMHRGIEEKLPTIITKDGYVKIYEHKTNTFGVYSPQGKTENYFKPTPKNYFRNEIQKILGDGGKIIYPLP